LKLAIFILTWTIIGTSTAQVIDLTGDWKFQIGDDYKWASREFNDKDWEEIEVPAAWEDEGYHGYDGFAWYRTKFDGRELSKETIYYLNLGFIDDADEAYVNGELIGFSGKCAPKFKTAYNTERKYHLPLELINYGGDNTIAIRVFDGLHRGGIVDGNLGIYRIASNKKLLVDLQGIWSFAYSRMGERIMDDTKWQSILVPSAWEFQGHKYDGFAWYKRTFPLPANFTSDDVVLLLGKIDDFDKVYVNGKLIGATNDRRPYGESSSFEQDRIYDIPAGLLNKNGANTIEILVEDMGNVGGIYEGLVGIARK
jgi:beta-galactosidase/beta-glucuronidase